MAPRFKFRDLDCFADTRDPRRYYFLPSRPDLRRDGDGRPMFTSLDLGSSGYVMFTATWDAPGATVEALRREIATGHQQSDERSVTLSFAPVTSPTCHVLLGEGAGSFQTIASSATSGLPPYDALFNLSVAPARLRLMQRALQGDRGFAGLEYVTTLLVPSTASATFRSQSPALLSWLRSRLASGADARHLLDEAIDEGLAAVTVAAPDDVDSQMALEVFERVLTEAATWVPRWISEGQHGDLEVISTIERDLKEPMRAFADIGDIVAGSAVPR